MFMHTLRRMAMRNTTQFAKQQVQKPLISNVAKRTFSSGRGATGGLSGSQMFGAGLGMAAITGLTYLSYLGHQMRMNATPEQQLTLFHPVVQHRIQTTMAYFTGSIFATGGIMALLRNSSAVRRFQFPITIGSFAFLLGTIFSDYHKNWELKNAMFGGFVATSAMGLVPMIHAYGGAILFEAAAMTGVTMGSLGAVAWNAPSEQFLKMGGVLAIGLGGLLGVSLMQMFYPASRALYSI